MIVRKRPCPCGSGRLARDCCGRFRRLGEQDMALAHLSRQARAARDIVGPFSSTALAALQAEAAGLPAAYDEFTAALLHGGDSVRTNVDRLAGLWRRSRNEAALDGAAARADTPMARVAVAKAIVALREAGSIDEHLAAAAVLELSGSRSPITEAALREAARTVAGRRSGQTSPAAAPTPQPV